MLWNSVYEFFVIHIFGGFLGDDYYSSYISGIWAYNDFGVDNSGDTGSLILHLDNVSWSGDFESLDGLGMSLGNYLSLIATIITMVIIVTLCALFIWKIIKLVGGLLR